MKLLKIKDVSALTSLARATIYKYIKEGVFPKQVNLGTNCVAWVESEVLEWIEEKIAQRDLQLAELSAA
ncbi:helix-turn-helix transcriptional regulator [Denitrificimonas caeni]|uniref:helix-turn-helix transcriptional regulator n=1 Tax=Denitrificimonas caeni TaxID=521720 RepID=UPI000426F9AE|nr:AlpA family transcriptional regulator [Denitrificimonas caeni]